MNPLFLPARRKLIARLAGTAMFAGRLLVAGQSLCLADSAAGIRYSWSGNILPNTDDDPWQLGEAGQPFELAFTVSRHAHDMDGFNVEIAQHVAGQAQLLISGQELTFLGSGSVEFWDNYVQYDLFSFHGVFERMGHAIEIGSVVVLPQSTFQFFEAHEPLLNLLRLGA